MIPDWLTIPVADRLMDHFPTHHAVGRVRLILFIAGGDHADLSTQAAIAAVFGTARPGSIALDRHIEIIDAAGDGLSPDADAQSATGMDKHRLDVALSLGRHAAERAKLAGYDALCAGAYPPCTFRSQHCSVWINAFTDPYETLRTLGRCDIAALVGMMIAGAQIGLPALLPGINATLAACLAIRLHQWSMPGRQNSRQPLSCPEASATTPLAFECRASPPGNNAGHPVFGKQSAALDR